MRARVVVAFAVVALAGIVVWRCRGDGAPPPSDVASAPVVSKARLRLRDLQRQAPGTVRGTVRAGSSPIAHARVCGRPGDDPDELQCSETDATGAYHLALRPAIWQLWASAEGFAGAAHPKLALVAGKARDGIDFTLGRGSTEITGMVRDTRGRAVGDALVHVRVDGEPIATVQSRPDGAFQVRIDGSEAMLEAVADGYVETTLRTAAPATGIELVLLPEATLAGIVVEAGTRTPIADARVALEGAHTRTAEDGTFRATRLRPGRYKPTASSIGGYGEARESVLLRVGAHVDGVIIEVHPVTVVAGRIEIAGTGRGCPEGAGTVLLERRGSRELAFGRTLDDGEVLIEGVVPGVYAVRLGCAGYLVAASYPDLVVGDTDVEDVVWMVEPGLTLAGRVRTRSGDPVAGAVVAIDGGLGRGGRVQTAGDGRFEASGLPAGKVSVQAFQTGYTPSEPVEVTVAAAAAPLELVLNDRTGGVAGTVTDRAGRPLAATRVEVRAPTTTAGPSDTTDVHGAYEIRGLEPGTYEVVVESKWQRWEDSRTLATSRVRVERGAIARVALQVEPEDGRLAGVVVDERGQPVPDVAIDVALFSPEVEVRRRSYERTLAWTSATGTFEIAGLPWQPLSVRARIDGANEAIVDDVRPGQPVQLVLRSTGTISGLVRDPSGASVEDITLELEDRAQDLSRRERLFHTGGAFTFRDLPAGTYRLTADEDRQTSVTVTLAQGERREGVALALRPRHAIRGRLVDRAGRPLANYKLEVPHKEARDTYGGGRTIMTYETEVGVTDARGAFLIQGLVGAEVTISAGSLAAGPDPTLVEVKTVALTGPSILELGDLVMPENP